jgi:hypothetical protein
MWARLITAAMFLFMKNICLSPLIESTLWSRRARVHFVVVVADGIVDLGNEYFAFPHIVRTNSFQDCGDRGIRAIIREHKLNFNFRVETDPEFGAAKNFDVSFLPSKALNFAHRKFIDADLVQGIFHVIKVNRFNDSFDFFHGHSFRVSGHLSASRRSLCLNLRREDCGRFSSHSDHPFAVQNDIDAFTPIIWIAPSCPDNQKPEE